MYNNNINPNHSGFDITLEDLGLLLGLKRTCRSAKHLKLFKTSRISNLVLSFDGQDFCCL